MARGGLGRVRNNFAKGRSPIEQIMTMRAYHSVLEWCGHLERMSDERLRDDPRARSGAWKRKEPFKKRKDRIKT